jgi:apolipoprotein N-acyltransferase
MTMEVQPRQGSTPYVMTGNLPILAVCVLILGGFWVRSSARL